MSAALEHVDEAIKRIERFCAGPRIELFARETRPGSDVWGDEVGKFAAGGAADSVTARFRGGANA
jgi:N6-adenosine-specific RNA methylase IME4